MRDHPAIANLIQGDHMQHPLVILTKAIQDKRPAVMVTVIEVKGASPVKMGAQIALLEDGMTTGALKFKN